MAAMHTHTPPSDTLPPKPSYRFSGVHLPPALAHLRNESKWVAWKYEWKRGKWTKPPVDPCTGRYADVSNPDTWATFDVALAGMERHGLAGIGLVLTGEGDIIGIDLDDCVADSECSSPLAAEVIGYGETYAEFSPSGEGIRALVLGKIEKALKDDELGVELYGTGRYLTITGRHIEGTPHEIREAQRTIATLREAVAAATADKAARAKPNGKAEAWAHGGEGFFASINAAALARLDSWVPALHPTALKQPNGAWRITSKCLGRSLEEDLAYHPAGIRDHGDEIGLTPIDAVLRYGDANDVRAAAFWLCQHMGVEPAAMGWAGKERAGAGTDDAAPDMSIVRPNRIAAQADESGRADSIKAWPIMESRATHGIVGRIARLATANSEADPVAVIATTLTYAAAEFGRSQFIRIGDDVHHSRHFNTVVGRSSRARKGTSWGPVERIFKRAEAIRLRESTLPFPSGCKLKISNGPLSSGEGLVYAVRDGSDDEDGDDPGVTDKRLLVVEQELGAALRAFQRSGNNLSMILRRAFDGGTIEPLTKNNRVVATDPHVNIVGHITRHELDSLLTGTEVWNGFGNRFQWLMARRPKTVAFPEPMPDEDVEEIARELARVITLAHERGARGGHELVLSNSAQHHWATVYPELTRDYPGILGAVTSRQEAHARRLALTYAQLDGAERIEIDQLEAALAFCRYAFDSAKYLFGETETDPAAQKILDALTTARVKGLTQTEISYLFHRNAPAKVLSAVLEDLQERGRITLTKAKTGERGRSQSVWSINEKTK